MLTAFPGQWCIPGGWDMLASEASLSTAAQPMTHTGRMAGGHWLLPIFQAPHSSPVHLIVTADKPQQLTCFFPIHFATISSCGHSSQFLHRGRATLDCAVNPLVWQVQANPKHPCSSSLAQWPQAGSEATGSRPGAHLAVPLYPAAPSASHLQPLPSSERPNSCLASPELPPQFCLHPLLPACIASLFSHSHVLPE